MPTVIDSERLVDLLDRQRPGIVDIGERFADRDLGDAGHGDDVAWSCLGSLDAIERLGDVELGHLRSLDGAVGPAPGDLLPLADRAVADPADRQATDVRGRVEIRDESLERMLVVVRRGRDRLEQEIEEGPQVVRERIDREAGFTGLGVAIDDRELDLALVGVEVEEQLVDLVHDLVHAGVRSVDLVDDEDDAQTGLERLPEDEPRLRERPFAGVHEQEHTVDHPQPSLDLTAEVGMARRVDDVDLRRAVADGRVLREDGDALLALQVHRVHHALGNILVRAERSGLPEHRVDQRGLAVVDVCHDGDVPDVVARQHRRRVAAAAGAGADRRVLHPAYACTTTGLRGDATMVA